MNYLTYLLIYTITGIVVFTGRYFITRYNLRFWVKQAVMKAEMVLEGGEIKKEWVRSYITKKYPKINEELLDMIIEATVYQIKRIN